MGKSIRAFNARVLNLVLKGDGSRIVFLQEFLVDFCRYRSLLIKVEVLIYLFFKYFFVTFVRYNFRGVILSWHVYVTFVSRKVNSFPRKTHFSGF